MTTKITRPVDLAPPPAKKLRGSSILATPRVRGSVAWADEAMQTPNLKRFDTVSELDEDAGSDDENDDDNSDHYQQVSDLWINSTSSLLNHLKKS